MSVTFLTDKDNVLRFNEQNLTEEEKAQARKNIGAISEDEVPEGGGGMGGADWNAAEGEPGHVLNRTHWVEGGKTDTLAFDGNIDGEEAYKVESFYLVKMSEYVESQELIGGAVTMIVDGDGLPSDIPEDAFLDTAEVFGVPGYMIGDAVIALPQDCVIFSIAIPKGLYFACLPGYMYTSELKAPSAVFGGEVVHKLDPKFLPDGVGDSPIMVVSFKSHNLETGEIFMSHTAGEISQALMDGKIIFMGMEGGTFTTNGQFSQDDETGEFTSIGFVCLTQPEMVVSVDANGRLVIDG